GDHKRAISEGAALHHIAVQSRWIGDGASARAKVLPGNTLKGTNDNFGNANVLDIYPATLREVGAEGVWRDVSRVALKVGRKVFHVHIGGLLYIDTSREHNIMLSPLFGCVWYSSPRYED